ncbi:MAG: STAS domain-containing protein [Candidatus Omnitrophica bacterium]|nr:STAS domain-containing protein [Candidatus Omnitrophota bacterium]
MLTIEPIQMGITAFRLTGSLDAMAVQVFDDEILYNIRENPFVILDLEPLHFLSSAGIRKLVSLEKELRKKGGYSVLSGASPQILQVLEISGLTAQFHLTTSLKAAEETIERDSDQGLLKQDLRMEDRSYNLTRFDGAGSVVNGRPASGSFAGKLCFVSLNELGYAMGEGCFSSGRQQALDTMGPFISLPGFFAYHPASDEKVTERGSGINR